MDIKLYRYILIAKGESGVYTHKTVSTKPMRLTQENYTWGLYSEKCNRYLRQTMTMEWVPIVEYFHR